MASRNKGFTLIELLAVIAIMGVLAGLIFTGAEKAIEHAKKSKTRVAIQSLSIALTNFERHMGSFDVKIGGLQIPTGPTKHDKDDERITIVQILSGKRVKREGGKYVFGLLNDIREDPMWNGPYLDPKLRELEPDNKRDFKVGQLVDAWGNPLMIRIKDGNWDGKMRYRPDSFEIWSWGPNGHDEIDKPGFGDDVTNWE